MIIWELSAEEMCNVIYDSFFFFFCIEQFAIYTVQE
jgi:hypothetical protein